MAAGKKKILYWVAGIAIAIVVVIGALAFYVAVKFEPIVKAQLQKQVELSSNGLYKLDVDGLSIELFLGRIYLEHPKLVPDTVLYQKLKVKRFAPPSLYNFSSAYIRFTNVNFWKLYFNKQLDIGLLLVHQPQLILIKDLEVKPRESKEPKKNLYQLISKTFHSINVDEIKIVDGNITYKRVKGEKSTKISISNFTILLDDVLIDSLADVDTSRFFYAKNIRVQVDSFAYATPNKQYLLKISQFNLSTKDSTIILQNVAMVPQYGKLEFAHVIGEQVDRFNIKADTVAIRGAHLRTFLFDEKIMVNEIDIIKPVIESFRDKNVTRKRREKLLFHEMLQEVPHFVWVRRIFISEGYVEYGELPMDGKNIGTVYFSNLKATFKNVTNVIDSQRPFITVDAQAFLMGSGILTTAFKFPVNPKQKQFNVTGNIKPMDLRRMNPVLEKLAYVRIKSGELKKMDFTINADPVKSKTYMKFLYDDLEIQLINKKTGTTESQGLASTVVNALIIEKSNPIPQVPPRIANVSYTRDQTRSVFNFLWKSLFTALKPSVGVSEKKESKINEFKDRLKASKEKRKKKREIKRQQKEEEKQQSQK